MGAIICTAAKDEKYFSWNFKMLPSDWQNLKVFLFVYLETWMSQLLSHHHLLIISYLYHGGQWPFASSCPIPRYSLWTSHQMLVGLPCIYDFLFLIAPSAYASENVVSHLDICNLEKNIMKFYIHQNELQQNWSILKKTTMKKTWW